MDNTVIILSINDVYSMENFSKLSEIKKQIKQEYYITLNGDFLSPYLLSILDKGVGMIKVLNNLEIDYVCFGNHEFDIGISDLQLRITEFNGIWLDTNIDIFKNTSLYDITVKGGIKIAWLGLCMDNLNKYTVDKINVKNVINIAKKIINFIKSNHDVDIFISLTHQEYKYDKELLKNVPEIRLILGGHDHNKIVKKINNSYIIKVGMNLENIGIIKLTKNEKNKIIIDLEIKDINLDSRKDETMQNLIESLCEPINNIKNSKIFIIPETSSTKNVRSDPNEIVFCQTIMKMIRKYFNVDICILNSGYFRGKRDYLKDDIFTFIDMYTEFPIVNNFIKINITGKEIIDLLNYSKINYIGHGRYLRYQSDIRYENLNENNIYSMCITGVLLKGLDDINILKKIGKSIDNLDNLIDSGINIYDILIRYKL